MTISPEWIAGFIDGDGSFALDKVASFYRPSLSISQNDPQLLYQIKDYFGCGSVTQVSKKNWRYRCRSANDFHNFIIPKLGNSPFQTIKQFQYELIRDQALPLLLQPNSEGRLETLQKLDNQIRLSRQDSMYVNSNLPISFDWFLGFFEAEGNFYVTVKHTTTRADVRIACKITQRNKPLLQKIQNFFGFGAIQIERHEIWKYNVEGIKNVINHAYPIFRNHPLKGRKNLERVRFLSVIRILAINGHRTPEGLDKIERKIFFFTNKISK